MWLGFHKDGAAVGPCRPQGIVGPQTPAEQFTSGRNAAGVGATRAKFPEGRDDGNRCCLTLGAFTGCAHLTPFVASPTIGTAAIRERTHMLQASDHSAKAGPRRRSKHLQRLRALLSDHSANGPPACDRPTLRHGAGLVRVTRSRGAHVGDLKAGEYGILRKDPERHRVPDVADGGAAAWREDRDGLDGAETGPQRMHTPDRVHRENVGLEAPPLETRTGHVMSQSAVFAVGGAFDGENGGDQA
jgi:hypothetical protein